MRTLSLDRPRIGDQTFIAHTQTKHQTIQAHNEAFEPRIASTSRRKNIAL